MEQEEIAVRLTEYGGELRRHEARIRILEQQTAAVHELAKSAALMAQELEAMSGKVDTINKDVSDLKSRPGRRWDGVVEKLIAAVIGGLIGYLLVRLGLGG